MFISKTYASPQRRLICLLWFAQHDSAVHDTKGHISKHYYLDEFVCVEQLLNYKGKYFW